MEERTIKIIYGDTVFDIKSDTPNFSELIDFVKISEDIDFSKIKVECDDEMFDTDTFKEAVVESLNELIEKIKIDNAAYEKSIKCINKD